MRATYWLLVSRAPVSSCSVGAARSGSRSAVSGKLHLCNFGGVVLPSAVGRDFGVGDGDGAGGGFAACGFAGFDGRGLCGFELCPPCRVDVAGFLAWLWIRFEGAGQFGRGPGRGVRVRHGWPGVPCVAGGLPLGGDGGFGLVGLGGELLPPCGHAAGLALRRGVVELDGLLPVVGGLGVGQAGFGCGLDAAPG